MKILRRPAVIEMTGLSRDTIRRHVAAGAFPAPVVLGRYKDGSPSSVGWVEEEIYAWLEARKAERDSPKAA
jgi:prophage regulatory protein